MSGIPCHAWCSKFFEHNSASMGSYIECDADTLTKMCLDMARIKIKTRCLSFISEAFYVLINGTNLRIIMVEEPSRPEIEFLIGSIEMKVRKRWIL